MTTALGRGVSLEFALTYSAAKTVSAVTKASPGVATSTSHGMSNGQVGYWSGVEGMVQLEGQASRVYNQSTNAFDLQGLDTSSYTTFSGSADFTPVSTYGTYTEMIEYQIGGGAADQLDDSKMSDIVRQIVFGLLPAQVITINTLSQTVDSATASFLRSAAIASTYVVGRITLHDGAVRVFRGVPSLPGENLARGALGTGSLQIACKGLVLLGAP